MITESVLLHAVAVTVSVREYVVVVFGLTDGLDKVEVNPFGELVQLYLLPVTEPAPRETGTPAQMVEFAIVLAAGSGFTVTTIELVFTHPAIESLRL